MASVTSTYARAFADVVFDQRLDPAKTLQEAQSVAQLVGRQPGIARSLGERPRFRRNRSALAGRDCRARRPLPAGAKFCGRADRSPAHQVSRSDRERIRAGTQSPDGIRRSPDHQRARVGRRRNGARSKPRSQS